MKIGDKERRARDMRVHPLSADEKREVFEELKGRLGSPPTLQELDDDGWGDPEPPTSRDQPKGGKLTTEGEPPSGPETPAISEPPSPSPVKEVAPRGLYLTLPQEMMMKLDEERRKATDLPSRQVMIRRLLREALK